MSTECEVCKGKGEYTQTYTAGCGFGSYQSMGRCDYCDGTGKQKPKEASASSPAAVPEGALPPLPKDWKERLQDHADCRPGEAERRAMMAEIYEWRARAAVEADRAQRPENARTTMQLALAALAVATTPFAADRQTVLRAQAALRAALADRAQQGEPVAWIDPLSVENLKAGRSTKEWMWAKPEPGNIGVYLATKAAAPADAPIAEVLMGSSNAEKQGIARVALAPAGQHDANFGLLTALLTDFLCREMPAGTVIGSPDWWAAKIARVISAELNSRAQRTTIDNENCRSAPVPGTGVPTAGEAPTDDIPMRGGAVLRFETRTTGERGWLLYDRAGTLVRAMTWAEVELIDSALASRCRAQGGMTKDNDNFRAPVSSTPTSGAVEGWKLVPETITEDMHVAAVRAIVRATGNDDFPPAVWSAMIAAAPSHPSEAKAGEDA